MVIEGGPGFPITKQTVTPVKSGPAYWAEPLDAPWGNWSVEIPPPSDVTRNYSFKVYIQEDPTDGVTVNDVVFGEVIVYGGQVSAPPRPLCDTSLKRAPMVAMGASRLIVITFEVSIA